MANTGITTLVPIVTQALDIVSREQVGFLPSVNRDAKADRLAKNQTLYSWTVPAATLSDVTPGAATPTAGDKVLGNKSISITNFKMTDWYFTGEEIKQLGDGYGGVLSDYIEQGVRAIVNQMETDIFTAAYVGASRGYGTAGTTPFGTNTGESAQMKKILDDNGAPMGTRSLIIDTTAGAALRTLTQLTKVNEAGTSMTLRDGEILNLNGFMIKESNAVSAVTKGSGASYVLNGAHTAGATSIVIKTGTGTVLAGDVITIGNYKYVVTTGVSAAGTIVIGAPGLKAAGADGDTVTITNSPTRNIAFSRNSILFASRLCAMPDGGDIAEASRIITDSRSGMSVELTVYKQYRQVRYELSAAWGVSVIKPEHMAILLG